MRWTGQAFLIAAGLALACYPLSVLLLAGGMLTIDMLHRDAREEWTALWRGAADATVTEVRWRCRVRGPGDKGDRRRVVTSEVPCEMVDETVAARPPGTYKLGRVREVVIAFQTADGTPVETVSYPGILRLPDPVEAGQRLRVSYDRQNPAKSPVAARGIGALVALAVWYAALLALALAAWRWLRRGFAGVWGRLAR